MEKLSFAQMRQRQDDEIKIPNDSIKCRDCAFRKDGKLGYKNAFCDMYERGKPLNILWENADCEYYQVSG